MARPSRFSAAPQQHDGDSVEQVTVSELYEQPEKHETPAQVISRMRREESVDNDRRFSEVLSATSNSCATRLRKMTLVNPTSPQRNNHTERIVDNKASIRVTALLATPLLVPELLLLV